jgi:hypothetical protein
MNNRMNDLCSSNDIPFINVWSTFWKQDNLFEVNPVLLNPMGAAVLALQWQKSLTTAKTGCVSNFPPAPSSLVSSSMPLLLPTSNPEQSNNSTILKSINK